jgi:hypothetical protein
VNRARDRRVNDPDFIAWQKEYQAEQDAAKAAADAAQAVSDAAAAQTPEAQYKAAINELHAEERNAILNGVISDINLAKFGTIVRGRCSEEQKVAARIEFRKVATDYVRNEANGTILCSMVDRNRLHPGAVESYLLCHAICKLWGLYTDEAAPVEQPVAQPEPEVIAQPALTRSEQAIVDHQRFMEEVVGTDELGRQWTAFELDQLPAKDELRLRRLFEQGHRGSNLLTARREILDTKQIQDAERARIAAEQNGGN